MNLEDDFTDKDLPVMVAALSHAKVADAGARLARQIPADAFPITDAGTVVKALLGSTKSLSYLGYALDEQTLIALLADHDVKADTAAEMAALFVDALAVWQTITRRIEPPVAVPAEPPVPNDWSYRWGRLAPTAAPFTMAR
jgi:hypothetical protein